MLVRPSVLPCQFGHQVRSRILCSTHLDVNGKVRHRLHHAPLFLEALQFERIVICLVFDILGRVVAIQERYALVVAIVQLIVVLVDLLVICAAPELIDVIQPPAAQHPIY